MKMRVKSKEDLEHYFEEIGAKNVGDSNWIHNSWKQTFVSEMWEYCGKPYEGVTYSWLDEWLEEVPEEDKEEAQIVSSPTTIQIQHVPKKPIEKQEEEYTTKHYDFTYKLTEKNIEDGFIKIDPYFVGNEWGIGEKDPSGILSHELKTIARFGEKNSKHREALALIKQAENLLRFY